MLVVGMVIVFTGCDRVDTEFAYAHRLSTPDEESDTCIVYSEGGDPTNLFQLQPGSYIELLIKDTDKESANVFVLKVEDCEREFIFNSENNYIFTDRKWYHSVHLKIISKEDDYTFNVKIV